MSKKFVAALAVSSLFFSACTYEARYEDQEEIMEDHMNEMMGDDHFGMMREYVNEDLGYSFMYPIYDDHWGEVDILENGDAVKIEAFEKDSEEFLSRTGDDIAKTYGMPFGFAVRDVADEEEVDQFIKDVYGPTCSMGELTQSPIEGEFWVGIDKGDELDENGIPMCFVNYITFVRFSPEKGKVASWDMGQDYNFVYQGEIYDEKISDSFRFL